MLAHSSVPISYWPHAFQYVVYLINRLPTNVLNNKTPFDLIYDKSPSYSSFRVFGCSCFPFLRPLNQHKLQFRSTECVLLGFSPHHKGYLCLNRQTGQIYVSRHVVFNEFSFPFSSSFSSSPPPSSMFTPNIPISLSFPLSTTPHPIYSSFHSLHQSTFPLSSHSPSPSPPTSLSPRLS